MGKFANLERYIITNNQQEIELTFDKIESLIGEKLCKSAYIYPAYWSPTKTHTLAVLIADNGYTIKADLQAKKLLLVKGENPPKNNIAKQHRIVMPVYTAQLDIETAIKNIRKYHDTSKDGVHTRYRSWAHCYKAFRENRHNKDKVDFLCLHLAWYLASWGMLRNSFLLNRDYLVHEPLVKEIVSGRFESLFTDNHTPDMIPLTMEASKEILKAYAGNSITQTLITKILIGVFGCAPAYDRYFIGGAKKYKVCSVSWSQRSLTSLWQYYEHYREAFEKLRYELNIEGLQYTPMKLLDMCLWQIGFDELEKQNE